MIKIAELVCWSVEILEEVRNFWQAHENTNFTTYVIAIRVMEFSIGGYKSRKIFALESTYPKDIFEFWELD